MIYHINIGVCLERPPKADEYRRYAVLADNETEAQLIALQMACCTSVMPVEVC